MDRIKLICAYCGEEIADWEEVFVKDKQCYHKACFSYEFEFEYYNHAEDLKSDLSFCEWWECRKNDNCSVINKTGI